MMSAGVWRKSSHSSDNQGACVEVNWRKSSHSGDNQGTCVEVNDAAPGVVLVRDSKDREGPRLSFEPTAWSAFVEFAAAQHA